MAIRLLIVDDHPVVRDGLRGMFHDVADIEVVGEAASGTEALAVAARQRPDVVLMDLRMPKLDGADAITRLRQSHPEVRVLVLTVYDTDADINRSLAAGAAGYLLKDAPREELHRAVRAAAAGHQVLAPAVTARLIDRLRAPVPATPSPRELEVLRLVARGATNREIARKLLISETTTKTHIAHLLDKLGVDNRTAAVAAAIERGYLAP